MRKNILFISLLFSLSASATNYYVDTLGSDSNDGLTTVTAWKTITRVNTATAILLPGDSVLFKRGQTWYGYIKSNLVPAVGVPGTAVNNIVFGAYGSGARPKISGFTKVTGWEDTGGGIWRAYVPAASYRLNMLVMDGIDRQIGKYPNGVNRWLKAESRFATTWIRDLQLANDPNYGSGDVHMRMNRYISETDSITIHDTTDLHYKTTNNLVPPANWGYFVQNHYNTLDSATEWFYSDPKDTLYMYMGADDPNTHVIQVATIDTLFYISGHGSDYWTITNMHFEGANMMAVALNGSNFTTIKNSTFKYGGGNAVQIIAAPNSTVRNCNINYFHCISAAINCNTASIRAYFGYDTVKNSGVMLGMAGSKQTAGVAIWGAPKNTIEYCVIDSAAYDGIYAGTDSVFVRYNFVNNTQLYRDDGGGIYVVGDSYANRSSVDHNIVLNQKSTNLGTTGTNSPPSNGIYLDNDASNYDVLNNTVSNSYAGVFMHSNHSCLIKNNNLIDNQYGVLYQQGSANKDSVRNNTFRFNVVAPVTFYKRGDSLYSNTTDNALMQSADSNYFILPNFLSANPFKTKAGTVAGQGWTLLTRQTQFGWDLHSTEISNNTAMLFYNETNAAAVKTFSGTFKDVYGSFYTNSITLQPYTSAILYNTPDVPPPPEEAPKIYFKARFN